MGRFQVRDQVCVAWGPRFQADETIERIVERIDADAKIIGYSSMFSSAWTYDKKILKRIRERFPKALIVAGGEHITACSEYVLQDSPAIDLCVRGEGEETLLDIVNAASGELETVIIRRMPRFSAVAVSNFTSATVFASIRC